MEGSKNKEKKKKKKISDQEINQYCTTDRVDKRVSFNEELNTVIYEKENESNDLQEARKAKNYRIPDQDMERYRNILEPILKKHLKFTTCLQFPKDCFYRLCHCSIFEYKFSPEIHLEYIEYLD